MNGWQVFVEIAGRPPVELRPGESIVGRSRTAQVQVPDSTVSRQHARLLFGALGEVMVEDLGSSNGTIVNGARVEGRHKLVDGDRILVGDVELRLRVVAPVAPSEATVRMVLPPMGAPPAAPLPPPAMSPSPTYVPPAPLPLTAAPSPLSLPLQTPPPPVAPPAIAPAPMPPPPIAPPVAAPPPIAAAPPGVPNYTVPIAPQSIAPPPIAPRSIDPPLRVDAPAPPAIAPRPIPPPPPPPAPVRPPAPAAPLAAPPARPQAAPAPAAQPAVSPRTGAARGAELPSVTVIDRIPIPQPTAEVLRAAKLARATPAGFWIRVLAALVDGALVGIVSALFGALAFFLPFPEIVRLGLVYVVSSALAIAYPLVFWATQGATPGKKLLGLRIVTATSKAEGGIGWGTAILRSIGYLLSGALLGLGFLLVAFTSQKQGLHDLIASTRVVRVR